MYQIIFGTFHNNMYPNEKLIFIRAGTFFQRRRLSFEEYLDKSAAGRYAVASHGICHLCLEKGTRG